MCALIFNFLMYTILENIFSFEFFNICLKGTS